MQPLAQTFVESRPLRLFSRWLPYGLILLFALISAIARIEIFPQYSPAWHIFTFGVAILAGFVFWYGFDIYIRLLDRWLPYERSILRRILIQVVVSLALLIMMRTFTQYLVSRYYPYQPTKLVNLFLFMSDTLFVLSMNLGYVSTHFFRVWKQNVLRAERLQKEAATVRFDNLRNQLNPHFLFNSLTSLNSLIHEDQALASQFLQQLARVYRYVLQHKDEQLVSLSVELDFIKNYLSLLKTRFGDALLVNVCIPSQHCGKMLVPVTLQILVENALKHNRLSDKEPLRIDICADEAGTILTVSNNLQRRPLVETSNRTGLDSLKALYRFYTPAPVQIGETQTEFYVKVPLVAG